MNYFLKKNESLLEGEKFLIDYEIDNFYCLKEDMVKCLNCLNKNSFPLQYNREKNMIYQKINNVNVVLGVDYIGPSNYYLDKKRIDKDIKVLINIESRCIGGHLLFPTKRSHVGKVNKSLNEIRSYRFKERLDYFLFELKSWYIGENQVTASKEVFEGNRKWFEQFDDFKGYINYFLLNDFVNSNYDIYDLSSYDNEYESYKKVITEQPKIEYSGDYQAALENSYIPKNYYVYVKGCIRAIKKRTQSMTQNDMHI